MVIDLYWKLFLMGGERLLWLFFIVLEGHAFWLLSVSYRLFLLKRNPELSEVNEPKTNLNPSL